MNLEDRLGELLTREDQELVDPCEFESEPELVRAIEAWNAMCVHIGAQHQKGLPDGDLFVLCALEASGNGADLTAEERERVGDVWPAFEAALQTQSELSDIVDEIGRDRNAFVAIWDAAPRARIRRVSPAVWRIAAVVALAGFAGMLLWTLMRQNGSRTVVTVAEASMESLHLPDGSIAHMVGPAEVRYNAAEFDRTVELTGGAFFDVADGSGTFAVHTDEAVARVLGTRFGILDQEGITEVVVESGRVEVASDGAAVQRVIVAPGQMSRVAEGQAPTPPADLNLAQALEWTGMLFFRATPMSEVTGLLSARFGVEVSADASLAVERVTGSFAPDDSLEHILSVLATTLDAVAAPSENGWHVSAR